MRRWLPLVVSLLGISCVESGTWRTDGAVGDPQPERIARLVSEIGGAEASLDGWSFAELDGVEPPELVVRAIVPGGEGTFEQRTGLYRFAGGEVEALAPPLVHGGYRDPGYLRVVDLDRDGQDELLVVGDTSGDSTSELGLYAWTGEGVVDLVWDESPGTEYATWDVDGDGRLEIVALGASSIRALALLEGRYRLAALPEPDLPDMAAHLFGRAHVERPWHLVPLLLAALHTRGVRVDRSPELAAAVRARAGADTSGWEREAWLAALAHVDPEAVLHLAEADHELPLAPAAWELVAHGEDDAALLRIFRRALRAGRVSPFVEGVLRAARATGDPRPARVLAEVVSDAGVPRRLELLVELSGRSPEVAPTVLVLLSDADPARRLAAAEALRRVPSDAVASWTERLPTARLLPLLEGDPDVRSRLLSHLALRRDHASSGVFLDALADPATRPLALHALAICDRCEVSPERLVPLLGTVDGHEANTLHRLIAGAADPHATAAAIDAAESRSEVAIHLRSLSRVRARHGDAGAAVVFAALRPLVAEDEQRAPLASDEWARADVVRELPALGIEEAHDAVRQLFRASESIAVQSAAAEALGRVPGGDEVLARWLREHREDDRVAEGALKGLEHAPTAVSRAALASALEQGDGRAYHAANALAAHRDAESAAILRHAFEREAAGAPPPCVTLGLLLNARLEHGPDPGEDAGLLRDLRTTATRCPSPIWARNAIHQIEERSYTALTPWLEQLRDAHPEREIRALARGALVRLAER